jgi:hypothetical protein
MDSATRLDDLKILECFLQDSLHAHLGRIIPFRIHCAYRDKKLWVLAQHPADVVIDIADTFRVLERALQAEEPKSPLEVELYLRAQGNERPYSHQRFTVYPLVQKTMTGEAAPQMTGMSEDRLALSSDRADLVAGKPIDISEELSAEITDPSVPNADLEPVLISDDDYRVEPEAPQLLEADKNIDNRLVKVDVDSFAADIEHSFGSMREDTDETTYPPVAPKKNRWVKPVAGALGLLAIGGGAGYVATRPCSFGDVCPEVSTAQQLSQSAFAAIADPQVTGGQVLTAQSELHQGIDKLKSIPFWSPSYTNAQKSLQDLEPQSGHLDTAVLGMNKAFQAANTTKNPPVTLPKWQQSKELWTTAISNLEQVPRDSKVYPLTQNKLTNYKQNLSQIELRIQNEIQGEERLKSAVDGAKAAAQAQITAKSLPDWQRANAAWNTVNAQLQSIPTTTTFYAPAQELLKSYQPQMAAVKEKLQSEEKAAQNYQTAVKLAQAAKAAQQNNQLAQAVAQWNQSVVAIQSIPQTSAVYPQAKPLVFEYTKSFQQAEEQLKTTQKITQANRDLQTTCAGNPQICSYTVNSKLISVRLMPVYTQTVMQTAIAASSREARDSKMAVINHIVTLGEALQTISENAKIPLEIYGADGKKIQTYQPRSI